MPQILWLSEAADELQIPCKVFEKLVEIGKVRPYGFTKAGHPKFDAGYIRAHKDRIWQDAVHYGLIEFSPSRYDESAHAADEAIIGLERLRARTQKELDALDAALDALRGRKR